MNTVISETDIFRLAEGSHTTAYHAYAAQLVSRHFRSMHYLSSKLICDCIVLNNVLNDTISPTSADEIITCFHRKYKSIHSTINSAFFAISDSFDNYARTVLGSQYDNVRSLSLRTTEYIVYVLSLDLSRNEKIDSREVYSNSYNYDELLNGNLPHY